MGYKLKTLFMKKMIAKKQKNNPFDYEAGENYALSNNDDWSINNSYYFSAHGAKESLYCRLGIRNCHSEVWFYYSDGSELYVLKDMLFKGDVPLNVHRTALGWKVEYKGQLTKKDGLNVSAEFEGEYSSSEPPVDFFSHMPPIRTAKAMAGEKWSKEFFAEVQSNNQVHYEQTGRLVGLLKIEDKIHKIDLPCVRDHSYGKRDWNYMNNHLWLMAVNETSQFNFSMVSYPAMTLLEVGNFKRANKPMAFMIDASYDRSAVITGSAPNNLNLTIILNDKSKINVVINKTDEDAYLFQNGDYCLIEGIAQFTIGNEKYRGILEVGFNKDKNRIFNGKDLRKIKI
ncbi:MAG: hypothetical protein J1F36_01400 [Clostridiales bacterium]|nr:hypothetical protein [Clostridiales bacterium]